MLKIGHRGAAGYEPENTLRSFRKAIELKVGMIELDVQTCQSGEVVVMHDRRLHKTTNGSGDVLKTPFSVLRKLNAGQGEKVPLLTEALDLIDRRVKVDIELKGEDIAEPVAEIIKFYVRSKGWAYLDFLITSFDHHLMVKMKSLIPDITIGLIQGSIPLGYAQFAQDVPADVIILNQDILNQEYINDAHDRNIKVFVYTVDDVEDILRIKTLGVDGVISNFPDRL